MKFISKMLYISLIPVLKLNGITSNSIVKALWISKHFYTKMMLASAVIAVLLMLSGCFTPSLNVRDITWKTYKNSRYSYEFPYPSNWNRSITPTNDDGIALVSPKNKSVEIRAWASNQLPESISPDSKNLNSQETNFQTIQGVKGQLVVGVGNAVSTMTLTLNQNQVRYNWQGKSPSQEFPNYYPLFYYIVQQYRIPQ